MTAPATPPAPVAMPALLAQNAPVRKTPSRYPEPFASRMLGRSVQPLGDLFGLRNFGVNRVSLAPGAVSALRHAHSRQDEWVYVLSGQPTLETDAGPSALQPGMCVGFPAGTGPAHRLANHGGEVCVFLVVGDRSAGDTAVYPDDDLAASLGADGRWQFTHKDGRPYA